MASFFKTYRITSEGERVDGVFAMAFIHNCQYHLTPISIYRDGMVDCWTLVTFEEFKQKVRSGWVVTLPPPNAKVSVSFLASFTATDSFYDIKPEEFILEVADEIEELNGRPTSRDRCLEAKRAYEAKPSDVTAKALRLAYQAVPEHNQRYVLAGIDRKNHPLHRILYPD